jgi:stage V sporulation protein G
MEITEVRVKLMEDSEDRLRGFCSITIDHCFVIRDLKIIDGTNGPFVAMPSRKLTHHCPKCGHKNHMRASFCNQCGGRLRPIEDMDGDNPQKLYADVAHPINAECRDLIQKAVIAEFEAELRRAAQPGYRSRYEDEFTISESPPRQPSIPEPHFRRSELHPPGSSSRPADQAATDDSFGAGVFD